MQTKNKGISIVYIPIRGKTKTFQISLLIMYLAIITLFAVVFFSVQFFSRLHQLKLNYFALSSFSEEEKQQLLSEELSVIQEELAEIKAIHQTNKDMTAPISSLDKDNRTKLNLRNYAFLYDATTKNQRLSSVNLTLNPATIYDFKETFKKQHINLKNRIRIEEIASLAADEFNAEAAKIPLGYPYGNAGMISPGFGYRIHPIFGIADYHTGVDISAPYGFGLKATGDGRVVEAGFSGGYGYVVKIYHRNGIESLYAHCSELLVDVGDFVKRGQVIAKAGNTGTASESHVHYEVIIYNQKVDPEAFNHEIEKAMAK